MWNASGGATGKALIGTAPATGKALIGVPAAQVPGEPRMTAAAARQALIGMAAADAATDAKARIDRPANFLKNKTKCKPCHWILLAAP
jgi:hypothetical protein